VFDRELVSEFVRCARRKVAAWQKEYNEERRKTAQQSGVSDTEGVCYSDEGG